MDPQLVELIEGGSGDDEVEVILKIRPGDDVPPFVRVVARFGDIATSRVRRDAIAAAWQHPAVLSAKAPRLVAAEVEPPEPAAASAAGLAEALDARGQELRAHATGATGRGVVVGVVDWGLDVAHPNFRNADGSTRVTALWDQGHAGGAAHGTTPSYGYGTVLTAADIDRALRAPDPYAALGFHPAASDPFGDGAHGTHVCDIAAGNGRAPGSPAGMAPEAEIVFVQLAARGTEGLATLGDTARILEALDFVRTVAGERPWVVNLSVGRCGGPHTGLTLVEQGIDALLSEHAGCAVAQSAGNYYAAAGHAAGQLRPGATHTLTWITDRADFTPNELEVWYPARDALVVEIAFPSGELAARVPLGERATISVAGRECGRVYHRRNDPSNGDHHVDVFLDPATAPAGAWRVTLVGDDVVDGRFDAWVERDSGCPACQSRFHPRDAVPARTTGTIANGFRAIAVGAYDARDAALALAPFSSCGPTRDGRQKPDLVAPGVRIVAARSAPRAAPGAPGATGAPGAPLTVKSGTSMAAPHVTGTIACMFEVARRPLWIHETRRLLMGNARGVNAPPALAARVGSGYLDPARAIGAAAAMRPAAAPAPPLRDASLREVAMTHETSGADGADDALAPPMAAYTDPSSEPEGADEDREHEAEEEACPDGPGDGGSHGEDAGIVTLAEAALHGEGAPLSAAALLERALAGEGTGLEEAVGATDAGGLAIAGLYDALTGRRDDVPAADRFDVIAAPGMAPHAALAAGDVVLRRPPGEPWLSHAAILATGEVIPDDRIAGRRWEAERGGRGGYAQVIEGGAFPHCRHHPFARRVLDAHGRVPPAQIVVRVRAPAPARAHGVSDLGEQAARVTVHVRNRLRTGEDVAGCEVELVGTTARGVTDARGNARLDLAGIADGRHTLRVLPASRTSDPVGPDVARATPRPPRIWRPLEAGVTVAGARITASAHADVTVAGATVQASVQPVWMASRNRSARRPNAAATITHIVVHHTGGRRIEGALADWVDNRRAATHYVIDTDGQVVKLVHESDATWHTGRAHWAGNDDVNNTTVAIEIVNAHPDPYPDAQYDALLDLVDRIRAAYPGIPAWNIVGHSDIGTCPSPPPSRCATVAVRRLGRKWTDPGDRFDWTRLEERGLGMTPAEGPLSTLAYGGFFHTVANGRLRENDRDDTHRYGGVARPAITTAVIRELQRDLAAIGYYCPATGVYDTPTRFAVHMFHEHFFAGRRPRAAHHGQVDHDTARMIKAVGMVPVVAPAVVAPAVAPAPAPAPAGGGAHGEAASIDAASLEAASLEAAPTGAGASRRPVRARILWPALGFPSVIAPRARPAADQMLDADATRCICVLLLSDQPHLSRADAARYLRWVRWGERGRRHIPAQERTGTFAEEELAVRDDVREPRLTLPGAKDALGEIVAFGGDRDGENGISVTLANHVRTLYRGLGLAHLHEIRVSEAASARLADGLHHLFWNNERAGETGPSDEVALLLRGHARPERQKLGDLWREFETYLLAEYEYEYGTIHPPYATPGSAPTTLAMRPRRAELLHPLFVRRSRATELRIGHITDLHVDVRADVYEENLARENVRGRYHPRWTPASYNNWNRSVERCYASAKRDSDVILLTGDLIDYGRGHWGLPARDRLGDDGAYHTDRNWFLLQHVLASGDAYTTPVYTILGNHDWRINPYPPFAPGAPSPKALIHNYADFTDAERKEILRLAHGPGHERGFSYFAKAKGALELLLEQPVASAKAAWALVRQTKTMDEPHTPTETRVESVAWYLLAINPFLDYSFPLPSGHRVLMLDWAEDENVLFPIVARGESWPYMVWQAQTASDPGPKASRCLTALQKRLVDDFASAPGAAKIVGIHAPPVGPYPDWFDGDLLQARKVYRGGVEPRGPTTYATRRPDGSIEKWNGHPFFAVMPPGGQAGIVADYGSFEQERGWFIRRVADARSGVRLVFSGHIHRNGLFVTYTPGAGTITGPAVAGQLLVRGVAEQVVRGARPPAVAAVAEGARGPLYVNTTSAGPRGNGHPRQGLDLKVDPGYAHVEVASDGTIRRVEFRAMGAAVTRKPAPVARPAGALVGP